MLTVNTVHPSVSNQIQKDKALGPHCLLLLKALIPGTAMPRLCSAITQTVRTVRTVIALWLLLHHLMYVVCVFYLPLSATDTDVPSR